MNNDSDNPTARTDKVPDKNPQANANSKCVDMPIIEVYSRTATRSQTSKQQIPSDIMTKLEDLSTLSAFSFDRIVAVYCEELKHLIKKGCQATNVHSFAYKRTFLRIKREYLLFWKCQYCTIFHAYGCSQFRISARFMRLLEKARKYLEKYGTNGIKMMLETISLEFSEVHYEVTKCVNKRSYQHHKLGYKTMDYEMPTSDFFKTRPIQTSLDPEKELEQELKELKKEKEQLQQRKQASKKGYWSE